MARLRTTAGTIIRRLHDPRVRGRRAGYVRSRFSPVARWQAVYQAITILALGVFPVAGCGPREAKKKDVSGCLTSDETVSMPLTGGGHVSLRSEFDGYGCNSIDDREGMTTLRLRPGKSSAHQDTHACLVLGPITNGDFELLCDVTTLVQSRSSAPNPHEVGWLVWNYQDNGHFYYLAAKPNGWELGKRDPSYPGGQQFLATGTRPKYPVGRRHELRITQHVATIEVWIDGQYLTTFTDPRPYRSGRIAFYCEDSEVLFDSLSVTPPPT